MGGKTMKIKVIVEDVGFNHAKVEIEENCGIEELKTMMDRINHELARQSEPANQRSCTKGQVRESNFNPPTPEPASKNALKALWGAAKSNGTNIESACRKFGVDPEHISKKDCWKMTNALNERSGYVNRNPSEICRRNLPV